MLSKFSVNIEEWQAKDQKWKEERQIIYQKWKGTDKTWKKKADGDIGKIGFLYEDLVSRDLLKSKGMDFARKFKLRNLSGLARLALPKNFYISSSTSPAGASNSIENDEEFQVARTDDWETSLLHLKRSRLLAQAASKHIPALRRWANVTRESNSAKGSKLSKLHLLEIALQGFDKC